MKQKSKKIKKILLGASSVAALGGVVVGTSVAQAATTSVVSEQGQIITENVVDGKAGSIASAQNHWSAGWGWAGVPKDNWTQQTFLRVNNSHNRDLVFHTFHHVNMPSPEYATQWRSSLKTTGEYFVPTDGRIFDDIVSVGQNGSVTGESYLEDGSYQQVSGGISIGSLVENNTDFKVTSFTYEMATDVGWFNNLFHQNYFLDSYLTIKTISYELV